MGVLIIFVHKSTLFSVLFILVYTFDD